MSTQEILEQISSILKPIKERLQFGKIKPIEIKNLLNNILNKTDITFGTENKVIEFDGEYIIANNKVRLLNGGTCIGHYTFSSLFGDNISCYNFTSSVKSETPKLFVDKIYSREYTDNSCIDLSRDSKIAIKLPTKDYTILELVDDGNSVLYLNNSDGEEFVRFRDNEIKLGNKNDKYFNINSNNISLYNLSFCNNSVFKITNNSIELKDNSSHNLFSYKNNNTDYKLELRFDDETVLKCTQDEVKLSCYNNSMIEGLNDEYTIVRFKDTEIKLDDDTITIYVKDNDDILRAITLHGEEIIKLEDLISHYDDIKAGQGWT